MNWLWRICRNGTTWKCVFSWMKESEVKVTIYNRNSFIILTLFLLTCTCRTGKMKQMPWMKTWSCWLEQTQLSKNHCNQKWNLTQWKASKHGRLMRSLSLQKVWLQSIPLQALVWHVSNPKYPVVPYLQNFKMYHLFANLKVVQGCALAAFGRLLSSSGNKKNTPSHSAGWLPFWDLTKR